MARRVFSDFDTELTLRLANRTDITSAMRAFFLNDAQFKLGVMYEHAQLQETTSETLLIAEDTLDVSGDDLWWVENLQNVTDNRPITMGNWKKMESVSKRTGPPMQYYQRGANSLFFDTLADTAKTIKVFYVKKPAQWSTGEAVFDEQYDVLLLMWAQKLAMETVRDMDTADAIGKQIGMYVSQMDLPLRKQQLNDRDTGVHVRFR
jgi:hypothetical protein